jgi:anti-anti-sigma regulatory factor
MAERKSLDGLSLTQNRGITLMSLQAMEIWDGADLSLLRDGLNHVILQQKRRSVAIDMRTVKYVPSGFFGMLFDWFEKGITIRLFGPQERVRNMLWFRQFFSHEMEDWYLLHDGLRMVETEDEEVWQDENWETDLDAPSPVAAEHWQD